jgi:hypothetical protein
MPKNEEEKKSALAERAMNTAGSAGRSAGGLHSSNASEIKGRQNDSGKILEEIKRYLDKQELPKLLSVFKEVKDCETIEPVFKKLKTLFFGNIIAPTKATDRQFD